MDNKPVELVYIKSECGDWEGIYVDGELFGEGHKIDSTIWIFIIKKYKNFTGFCPTYSFTEEQFEELGDSLPNDIHEIPEHYFKGGTIV